MAGTLFDPMGGEGKYIEADETYIGRKPGTNKRRGYGHKNAVVSLVERGGGVRSFHVPNVTAKTIKDVLLAQVSPASQLMTDQAKQYIKVGRQFARHEWVNHVQDEWARGDAHTNTVEGFFSLLKRGLNGIYHNVSAAHLHRYLAEFDFRYTNRELTDGERTALAIKQAEGKRLRYAEPRETASK
jgi:transposase-like protein